MNKVDYVNKISENLGLTKKDVSLVIDSLFSYISDDLKHNNKVMITNFGSFETAKTKPFDVYSPYDGKKLEGISQVRVHFKSSAALKKYINE